MKLPNMLYAMEPNWDNENADPLDEETIGIAQAVAAFLPVEYTIGDMEPDIYPTPRGEIDFSWATPKNEENLIIGVCPEKEGEGHLIAFSGVFGETHIRGRFPWTTIPESLTKAFMIFGPCFTMLGKNVKS